MLTPKNVLKYYPETQKLQKGTSTIHAKTYAPPNHPSHLRGYALPNSKAAKNETFSPPPMMFAMPSSPIKLENFTIDSQSGLSLIHI